MSRILVLGGSGLLGQYVVEKAVARGHRVWGTYRGAPYSMSYAETVFADLTRQASLDAAFAAARPDAVVLCAAMTSVDGCEKFPDKAERVNARGPALVAHLCQEHGARLVHVSTDYVFDGTAGPYAETAEPHPLSVYGRTKWMGETAVAAALPEAVVVRVCALYGWNRVRGTPNSVTWILGKLRRGKSVPLFTDQRVSPTYAGDAAPILLDLALTDSQGLFHIAPEDCVTRLELGQHVCEAFDLPVSLLEPSRLRDVGLKAERPRHSCLVSDALNQSLKSRIHSLPEALSHMRDSE